MGPALGPEDRGRAPGSPQTAAPLLFPPTPGAGGEASRRLLRPSPPHPVERGRWRPQAGPGRSRPVPCSGLPSAPPAAAREHKPGGSRDNPRALRAPDAAGGAGAAPRKQGAALRDTHPVDQPNKKKKKAPTPRTNKPHHNTASPFKSAGGLIGRAGCQSGRLLHHPGGRLGGDWRGGGRSGRVSQSPLARTPHFKERGSGPARPLPPPPTPPARPATGKRGRAGGGGPGRGEGGAGGGGPRRPPPARPPPSLPPSRRVAAGAAAGAAHGSA